MLSKNRIYVLCFNLFWLIALMVKYLSATTDSPLITLILSVLGLVCLVWQIVIWKKLLQDKTRFDLVLYLSAWILCIIFVILL
ncbi:hypothetical protein [Ligilactobacillus apodemi]|uniref:Uncharacterized protein n=1 Tax=Ligilactobacillus apodemi DSM 16634 = JCM 16172 TaxID=1423724 RepID=A0A0R1U2F2_9LACO|nr:hypothetical protein [Ligilactobacillus apodemi]KRL87118.1 hypothetical protein FC32_GL000411 [Ligilactobacillus apodemi DSM 16634 = JCM 16172]